MPERALDDFLYKQHQVPLYWLADDWGRWITEEEFLKELKWAILWNDVVFIPDDFILTNRYFRRVFDPSFDESTSIATLFRLGVLRIVVRDKHTGYGGEINSFSDAAIAIGSDPNFVWPRSEPRDEYVEHLHAVSTTHIARPVGINVDEKFRQKMALLTGQDGPSAANEYYSTLFQYEAHANQRSELSSHEFFQRLQTLVEHPRIRRSFLYRLANFDNLSRDEQREIEQFRSLSAYPQTLRSIGDDVFLHNLMENFLPIATFPEGHPTPIWLDSVVVNKTSDTPILHNVVTQNQLLPSFTGHVLSHLHSLSFENVRELRLRNSGIQYRRAVAQVLLNGMASDDAISKELFQSCSGYITDIARAMSLQVSAPTTENYILKWKLSSPVKSLRRISMGLVIQSLRKSSRMLRLFSTTITERLLQSMESGLMEELIKSEIVDVATNTQKSHQHTT